MYIGLKFKTKHSNDSILFLFSNKNQKLQYLFKLDKKICLMLYVNI